ncbi:unnamed protein product [Lactuca virosa]|uniref:Cyclin-dependent kinase inhibitor n=1 Tax=Lactuca virosa TaxID=75947 RepID=A0AAU9NAA4_9ASTR|nr:unnamed protein product [Lactuca virosa]
MIEEMCTSGCESIEEISAMEIPNSHGDARRSRDTDVTSSGTGKRRRLDSQDQENVFQLRFQSRREIDVKFFQNVVLTAVYGVSDHVSSLICSINDDSRPYLKILINSIECSFTGGISFLNRNLHVHRETSASSVVSLESEEMESLSTSTPKKKKKTSTANEATSSHKPPPEKSPSPAELKEFFSEAEKYEQKRFTEKYNYDIVKDVPMEGRYQWIRLKP